VYLALIRLQGFTVKQMVNPWRTYVRLSAVLMGSNGLTKGSLAFLNYPAQIMFKSTKVIKPIPVFYFVFFFCTVTHACTLGARGRLKITVTHTLHCV
jgi:hypothetical protein